MVTSLALRGRDTSAWGWLAGALAAGAVAGFAVSTFGLIGLAAAFAAALGIAVLVVSVRSPLSALALALAALPLDIFGRFTEKPIPLTVYQVFLLLALMSWAIALWRGTMRLPRFSPMDAGMLMLVVAGVWSLPHSLARGVTILGIARLIFIWAFVALLENVPKDRKEVRLLLGVIVWFAAAHAALGLVQAFVPGLEIGNVHEQGPRGWRTLRRVAGFFDDPNYYAGMLSAGLMIAGALGLHSKRLRDALVWVALAAVIAAGVLVTFSRTVWVACVVGVVVLAFTAPRKLRWWLVGGGLALAVAAVFGLALVAPQAIMDRLKSSTDVQGDESVATRVYMGQSMVEMIEDDPIWGTGLAAFDREYPYYRKVGSSRTILRPHQVPGGLIAETGIAGALALLTLFGGVVWLYVARGKRPLWAGESAALAGLACMSAQSLFQYYLYFEYLWVFVGLLVVAVRMSPQEEETRS